MALLYVPALTYHLPSADISCFSPQTYHQLYGGSSELDGDKVVMHLKQQPDMSLRHDIKIPIDLCQSNLPIIKNTACTKKELDTYGSHFKSTTVLFICNLVCHDHWNVEVEEIKYEFDFHSKICFPCVKVKMNLYFGIGNWVSVCIIYRNSCMYTLQKSQMKNIP